MAAPAVAWSLDWTSRAYGVAARSPDLTPLDFYMWGSLEGVGVRGENSEFSLTGYFVCIFVSIIAADTLNTFSKYKPFSFCHMVPDLWDLFLSCATS
jgi:hypothetical protein